MKRNKKLLMLVLISTLTLSSVTTYAYSPDTSYGTIENVITGNETNSNLNKAKLYRRNVKNNIVSLDSLGVITVPFGTKMAIKDLPKYVSATTSYGKVYNLRINWTKSLASFNPNLAGTYVIEGSVRNTSAITNTKKLKASISIVVENEIIPELPMIVPEIESDGAYVVNRDPNSDTKLLISEGTTIYEFDSDSEYKNNSSSIITLDTMNKISGQASVLIQPSEAISVIGTNKEYFTIETEGIINNGLVDMDNMQLNLYIPEKGNISYMLVRFYTDDTNYSFYEIGIGEWELVTGWNKIAKMKQDFYYVNYADATLESSWDHITRMEFFVVYENGMQPIINLDKIAKNVRGEAKILFTFDDGWKDVKEIAYPILDQHNFTATTWVNKDAVANAWDDSFMSSDDLNFIYQNGWDIGNHTVNHPDLIDYLSNQELYEEYLINQNWIIENGWIRGAKHVCYPSGQYSEQLIKILIAAGVESARTTVHGINPVAVPNIYKLKTIAVGRDSNIDKYVKEEIDKAVATGSSIIFMFHRVEETPEPDDGVENYGRIAVSTEVFTDLVNYVDAYVQKGEAQVLTISEWYQQYMTK